MLTQEELRKRMTYNPDTGVFTSNHIRYKGKVLGSAHDGYVRITIGHKHYTAHRLAYLYMRGEFPKNLVDHKDNNRSNNQWSNLREASYTENLLNTPPRKGSKSGFKNVFWDNKTQSWLVRMQKNKRLEYIGYYKDLELAALVAEEAREKYHGEFANHGNS